MGTSLEVFSYKILKFNVDGVMCIGGWWLQSCKTHIFFAFLFIESNNSLLLLFMCTTTLQICRLIKHLATLGCTVAAGSTKSRYFHRWLWKCGCNMFALLCVYIQAIGLLTRFLLSMYSLNICYSKLWANGLPTHYCTRFPVPPCSLRSVSARMFLCVSLLTIKYLTY